MKITFKSEYAIKALLDLSFRYTGSEIVPLTDISKRQSIPLKYLEQIMLILKKAGYVESRRGIGGGFMLGRSPESIVLGDVVRTIEGPLDTSSDMKGNGDAHTNQALKEIWQDVNNATAAIVDTITFAAIMRRVNELKQQNQEFIYYI